jgi:hypothetical protein
MTLDGLPSRLIVQLDAPTCLDAETGWEGHPTPHFSSQARTYFFDFMHGLAMTAMRRRSLFGLGV